MELVLAHGHENITSLHYNTLEVTKDPSITRRADCIVGVGADRGLSDLSEEFKAAARVEGARIEVRLRADGIEDRILGEGHPALTFASPREMVIRRSSFLCPRTLMIKADKSSRELDRGLVEFLRERQRELQVEIRVL
ncbi:MAG: DUF371 domain-containing protein [Euryarchaeota archaeon]|nr:DUF371 domain-containing protein [Euryarchaeota archaeon]